MDNENLPQSSTRKHFAQMFACPLPEKKQASDITVNHLDRDWEDYENSSFTEEQPKEKPQEEKQNSSLLNFFQSQNTAEKSKEKTSIPAKTTSGEPSKNQIQKAERKIKTGEFYFKQLAGFLGVQDPEIEAEDREQLVTQLAYLTPDTQKPPSWMGLIFLCLTILLKMFLSDKKKEIPQAPMQITQTPEPVKKTPKTKKKKDPKKLI